MPAVIRRAVRASLLVAGIVALGACSAAPTAPTAKAPTSQLKPKHDGQPGDPCTALTEIPSGYVCRGGYIIPE